MSYMNSTFHQPGNGVGRFFAILLATLLVVATVMIVTLALVRLFPNLSAHNPFPYTQTLRTDVPPPIFPPQY